MALPPMNAKNAPASLVWMLLGVLAAAGPPAARAQGLEAARTRVAWTATAEPAAVAPGETAHLVLRAQIADGWKMYAMDSPPPTRGVAPSLAALPAALSPKDSSGFTQSEPQEGYDAAFRKDVRYFEHDATLRAEVAVSREAAPGNKDISGAVAFMVCNAEKCLPPTEVRFTAPVRVKAPPPSGNHTP